MRHRFLSHPIWNVYRRPVTDALRTVSPHRQPAETAPEYRAKTFRHYPRRAPVSPDRYRSGRFLQTDVSLVAYARATFAVRPVFEFQPVEKLPCLLQCCQT